MTPGCSSSPRELRTLGGSPRQQRRAGCSAKTRVWEQSCRSTVHITREQDDAYTEEYLLRLESVSGEKRQTPAGFRRARASSAKDVRPGRDRISYKAKSESSPKTRGKSMNRLDVDWCSFVSRHQSALSVHLASASCRRSSSCPRRVGSHGKPRHIRQATPQGADGDPAQGAGEGYRKVGKDPRPHPPLGRETPAKAVCADGGLQIPCMRAFDILGLW